MPLVKHGLVRNGRTLAWRKWALSCGLGDPMSNKAMRMEIEMVERMERSAEDLARAVAAEAERPRWKPYIDALKKAGKHASTAVGAGRF